MSADKRNFNPSKKPQVHQQTSVSVPVAVESDMPPIPDESSSEDASAFIKESDDKESANEVSEPVQISLSWEDCKLLGEYLQCETMSRETLLAGAKRCTGFTLDGVDISLQPELSMRLKARLVINPSMNYRDELVKEVRRQLSAFIGW